MRRLRILLITLLLLSAAPAMAAPANYGPLVRALATTVIIPAYQRFADGMAELATATDAYCAAPSPETRKAVEAAYNSGMDAWEAVQPVDYGPVTENSRYSRIQFWPDKGGIAARHLRLALQKKDPAVTAPGGLKGRSVALQNLNAYEKLVFETLRDEPKANPYACALAAAIARFQTEQAKEILAAWQGPYQTVLKDDGKAKDLAGAMYKGMYGALDRIVGIKLEPPLGKTPKTAKPKRAESWRSSRSLANIAANLRMAKALYAAKGGFGDRLAAGGSDALDAGLRVNFDTLIAKAGGIGMPLSKAVTDPAARKSLEELLASLKDMRILLAGPVADELGIVIGFNASDGD